MENLKEDIIIDNDPDHADLVRAINCIEDALKFLAKRPKLYLLSDCLRINLEAMCIVAKRIEDEETVKAIEKCKQVYGI